MQMTLCIMGAEMCNCTVTLSVAVIKKNKKHDILEVLIGGEPGAETAHQSLIERGRSVQLSTMPPSG